LKKGKRFLTNHSGQTKVCWFEMLNQYCM